MKRRILAMFLVLAMLIGSLPYTAMAAEVSETTAPVETVMQEEPTETTEAEITEEPVESETGEKGKETSTTEESTEPTEISGAETNDTSFAEDSVAVGRDSKVRHRNRRYGFPRFSAC